MLRWSEAAALTWADVEFRSDGSGRLTVTRSKTDQEGEGAVQYLGRFAAKALRRIRGTDPPGRSVARRLAAMAKVAGLEGAFSGHSAGPPSRRGHPAHVRAWQPKTSRPATRATVGRESAPPRPPCNPRRIRVAFGLHRIRPAHPTVPGLLSGSCSSGPRFAYGFLQIPPRDGHPCPRLSGSVLPPSVRDSHSRHGAYPDNRDRGGPAIPVLPLPHHQACGSAPGGSVS